MNSEMLNTIQDLSGQDLLTWLVDSEASMINVLSEVLPSSAPMGCFLLFCKAIHRKVDSMGFREKEPQHLEFRPRVVALSTLAFPPQEYIDFPRDSLKLSFSKDEQITPENFERSYM